MATEKKSQPVYWNEGVDETAKEQAAARGISVSAYINYLVKQDAEKVNKRKAQYAQEQAK